MIRNRFSPTAGYAGHSLISSPGPAGFLGDQLGEADDGIERVRSS